MNNDLQLNNSNDLRYSKPCERSRENTLFYTEGQVRSGHITTFFEAIPLPKHQIQMKFSKDEARVACRAQKSTMLKNLIQGTH